MTWNSCFSSFLFVNFKQFARVIKKISFIKASTLRHLGALQASHGDVTDVICFAGSRWRKYTISLFLKVLATVQNASAVALYPLVKHVLVPLLVEWLTIVFTATLKPERLLNFLPFSCFLIVGKTEKSIGARSGEYGGWLTVPNPIRLISSLVDSAVWGDALSWCHRK